MILTIEYVLGPCGNSPDEIRFRGMSARRVQQLRELTRGKRTLLKYVAHKLTRLGGLNMNDPVHRHYWRICRELREALTYTFQRAILGLELTAGDENDTRDHHSGEI
jgi:hypothetical protein